MSAFEWDYEEVGQDEWEAMEQAVQAAEAAFSSKRRAEGTGVPDPVKPQSPAHRQDSASPETSDNKQLVKPLGSMGLNSSDRCAADADGDATGSKRSLASTGPTDSPRQEAGSDAAASAQEAQPVVSLQTTKRRSLPASWSTANRAEAGAAGQEAALPALAFCGELVVARTAAEVERACLELLAAMPPACGFDAEWRALFVKGRAPRPVALLQLCYPLQPTPPDGTEERMSAARLECGRSGRGLRCLLLHLHHSGVTPALRAVLETQDISLVGVGARGDAFKLENDFGVSMASVVDVPDLLLPRRVPAPPRASLSGICDNLLGFTVRKIQSIRCSNWEAPLLSLAQIQYAATDAMASLMVYWAVTSKPVAAAVPSEASEPPPTLPPLPAAAAAGAPVPELEVLEDQELLAASCRQQPLAPAKREVYHMFVSLGRSVEEIAVERRVQEATVQGYLADALLQGHAYPWHRLSVPEEALQPMLEACEQHLCGTPDPAPQQQPQGSTASSSGSRASVLPGRADAEAELRLRGVGLRALRELLPDWASYGHVRLSLAHITRHHQAWLRRLMVVAEGGTGGSLGGAATQSAHPPASSC